MSTVAGVVQDPSQAPVEAPAVEVADLTKRYPKSKVQAVDGISFTVARGEVFGLLGPNGAGKTTTVGILTTRVRATGGTARVGGVDVRTDPVAARRILGVVPQRNNLDRSLSVRQNLLFHAAYHGVPRAVRRARAEELLAQFGLGERADEKPAMFSGGQSQRMMIARALMHAPAVLFLDEPSTGLDPAARLFVWDRVRELQDAGTTILLTTHDMDEAASLADRIGIMDRGKLLALDTPEALIRQLPGERTLDVSLAVSSPSAAEAAQARLEALPGVVRLERLGAAGGAGQASADGAGDAQHLRLYVEGQTGTLIGPVVAALDGSGAALDGFSAGEPTLEDVFIHLTGRALR
ncbi:MAG TPA: ABC transporter ATP-binding protein [Actinomycetota bacterium]|nr:ABC transporter ATP-binding protein [Actinomycetota bacterium]